MKKKSLCLPKINYRLETLKLLETSYDDQSQKELIEVFPKLIKPTKFLPYTNERDSIGRLISKNVESNLAEVSELRNLRIIGFEKNDKICRLTRRRNLIFPSMSKEPSRMCQKSRIFHSFSMKNLDEKEKETVVYTAHENSLSQILNCKTTSREYTVAEGGDNENISKFFKKFMKKFSKFI